MFAAEAPRDGAVAEGGSTCESTRAAASPASTDSTPLSVRLREVARAFLPMGFIAFGGPQAHIALFFKEFVEKKEWLDEQRFLELMSLGQAMPGPTSTQMATAMGIARAGVLGGMTSFWLFDWVGFAIQLGVGTAIHFWAEGASRQDLNTFKMIIFGTGPAAIALVFIAAYTLGLKAVGDDPIKVGLALTTCTVALLVDSARNGAFVFLASMLAGGIVTVVDSRRESRSEAYAKVLKPPEDKGVLKRIGISRSVGVCLVLLTIALFVATQIVQENATVDDFGSVDGARYFAIFTSLYKMGISIYGGGQVVLPLLESEFVERTGYDSSNYTSSDFGRTSVAASLCLPLVDADGSFRCRSGDPISLTSSCPCPPVSAETFAFGLALAQSMPGPLFNFSAFLGAVSGAVPGGILGFLGLFGPGIMLIYAFMPFWEAARQYAWVRCGLVGMNAASIGLVFAACVTLFNKYCKNSAEGAVMLISMVLVKRFKIWPPVAIFGCAALCLVLFFLDVHGAGGDWCHVAKYGDFSTQDVSRCGEVASTCSKATCGTPCALAANNLTCPIG